MLVTWGAMAAALEGDGGMQSAEVDMSAVSNPRDEENMPRKRPTGRSGHTSRGPGDVRAAASGDPAGRFGGGSGSGEGLKGRWTSSRWMRGVKCFVLVVAVWAVWAAVPVWRTLRRREAVLRLVGDQEFEEVAGAVVQRAEAVRDGVEGQLSRDDLALLRGRRYVFAANYFNSEETVAAALPELVGLLKLIGTDRVAMSVYENGSRDRTPQLLGALDAALNTLKIRRRIVADSHGADWKYLCPEAGIECETEVCEQVRDCDAMVRIPIMAAIRNRALNPMFEPPATSILPPLPASRSAVGPQTVVVFLNDIYFTADVLVQLLLTNDMEYDGACATDFDGLKLYDTWVARDRQGAALRPWYPYFRDPGDRHRVRQGEPVSVYSCWNGAVALNGDAMLTGPVKFRSWVDNEPTSPHPAAPADLVFANKTPCTASECQLIFKDLWLQGLSSFYINPAIVVTYNLKTWFYQRFLMSISNKLTSVVGALIAPTPLTEQQSTTEAPRFVSCGLD